MPVLPWTTPIVQIDSPLVSSQVRLLVILAMHGAGPPRVSGRILIPIRGRPENATLVPGMTMEVGLAYNQDCSLDMHRRLDLLLFCVGLALLWIISRTIRPGVRIRVLTERLNCLDETP